MTASTPVNIALQGGGSHGAFTWGVLARLLKQENIIIDGISGCSSGAINGSLLAYGLSKSKNRHDIMVPMNDFWHELGNVFNDIFTPANKLLNSHIIGNQSSVLALDWFLEMSQLVSPYVFNPSDMNPLRELLTSHINFKKLKASNDTKLFIAATNIKTSKLKIFERQEISIDHVLASACLPSIHHAINIDGEIYWDGGFSGNPPVFPLIFNCLAQDIIIVLIHPLTRESIPDNAERIRERINEIAFKANFMREMRAITFSKRQIKEGSLIPMGSLERKLNNIRIHIISADDYIAGLEPKSRYNASPELLNNLYESGYECADNWLTKNHEYIGKQSSIELEELFE